jgi:hypothetical protein
MADEQFLIRGRQFVQQHPDFSDVLNEAERRLNPDGKGESLHADGVDEIRKLASPETAYYLARPENHVEAHALLGMKGERLRDKIRRINAKVAATRPFTDTKPVLSDVDEQLRQRKADIKTGLRRR